MAQTTQDLIERGVNVRQPPFNAKGDGTDETALLQSVIDYLEDKPNKVMLLPKTSQFYNVTGLDIKYSDLKIISDGATLKSSIKVPAMFSYFPSYNAQNGMLRINAKTDSITDFIEDIEIEGLHFEDFATESGGDAYD